MDSKSIRTLVTLVVAAGVAAALAIALPGSGAAAESPQLDLAPSRCELFTFSSCPNGCVQQCVPSSCSGAACTTDCDGPGSCRPRAPQSAQGNS